tara:strand:- start:1137 stop:1538 length:402 start_codon:yes stop_codon:yes gene_type:complete
MPPGSSFGTSANMIGLDNLVQLKSSVMTHPDSNVASHGSPNDTNLKGGLSLTFDTMDNLPDNGMSTFHKTSTHTTHSSSMLDDTTSFHQTQITPISLENKAMRGNLKDRYDAYVKAMIDLGLPYVDFDTWLNR